MSSSATGSDRIVIEQTQITPQELGAISYMIVMEKRRRMYAFFFLMAITMTVLAVALGEWPLYAFAAAAAFTALVDPFVLRWFLARYVRNPKDKRMFLPCRIEIDDEKIVSKRTDGSQGVYPWQAVVDVRKWGDGYLLFLSQIMFLYIKRSSFRTSEDWLTFEQRLRERYNQLPDDQPA
jgi:hypothetical protein